MKAAADSILKEADIQINGTKPWDILIHNDHVYQRVLQQGSLGLGESYVDGWWDCSNLDQFFFKVFSAQLDKKIKLSWPIISSIIKAKLLNMQSRSRAFEVGQQHYDLSNELFQNMLDPLMNYSCAYWPHAQDLTQAQENKLNLICKKLYLQQGMNILDIGCGWGGFAYYAAKNYDVNVVGITISKEQAQFAAKYSKDYPVTILLQDYRDFAKNTANRFDRIVSIGMFEHVGYKNYKDFLKIAHSLLKEDGLFLLHTIGTNVSNITGDPWINKYIFPNGMLPSVAQIGNATEGLFVVEDWHNFGTDYDKTLLAWHANFINNWHNLKNKYDTRFYRMWTYYLLMCAAQFRARNIQLWQIVLSNGKNSGYISVR